MLEGDLHSQLFFYTGTHQELCNMPYGIRPQENGLGAQIIASGQNLMLHRKTNHLTSLPLMHVALCAVLHRGSFLSDRPTHPHLYAEIKHQSRGANAHTEIRDGLRSLCLVFQSPIDHLQNPNQGWFRSGPHLQVLRPEGAIMILQSGFLQIEGHRTSPSLDHHSSGGRSGEEIFLYIYK